MAGSKKGFPLWAGAVVAVVVVALVALVAAYFIWRKFAARKELREQEMGSSGYFTNTMCGSFYSALLVAYPRILSCKTLF